MSLMKEIHENNNLPGSVLAVLVALLLLLAGVVWVAFCVAVHRAALRIAEMKRQRRRQVILHLIYPIYLILYIPYLLIHDFCTPLILTISCQL